MPVLARLSVLTCVAFVLAAAAGAAGSDEARVRTQSIFFWTDSPGPSLWAMRPDGSNRHRIYRTPQNAKRPALSPNGKWIAFDGAPPGKPPLSDFDIQIVRVDGTGRRTLAGSPATEVDAQWLPDRARLSFSREPPPADWRRSWIWTVRLDGSEVRRLGRGQFARWSPDGTRLVLDAPTKESEGDLFIVNADGSERRRLLATPALEQPAGWSPDGTGSSSPASISPVVRTCSSWTWTARICSGSRDTPLETTLQLGRRTGRGSCSRASAQVIRRSS